MSDHPSGDKRFRILDVTMKRHQYQPDALIEVLHKAQELFGFLDLGVLHYVARGLKLPPSRVYGVATFYHLFSLKPQGEHTCVVCRRQSTSRRSSRCWGPRSSTSASTSA